MSLRKYLHVPVKTEMLFENLTKEPSERNLDLIRYDPLRVTSNLHVTEYRELLFLEVSLKIIVRKR